MKISFFVFSLNSEHQNSICLFYQKLLLKYTVGKSNIYDILNGFAHNCVHT